MAPIPESTFTRYLVTPGLLLTSVLAIVLVISTARGWTSTGHFHDYVANHRASTQLVVQVLSVLLGSIHALTLTTLVNFRTRILLEQEREISLHRLSWWQCLCNKRLDFSLPWTFSIILLVFYGITLAPAALWAGAITPVSTITQRQSSILIPQYHSEDLNQIWNYTSGYNMYGANLTTTIPEGDFSFYPIYPFGGRVMDTASSASTINTTNQTRQTHAKYDNTRYSYSGRSYGVGSSVGLKGEVLNLDNLAAYSYAEAGYKAAVSCIVNETSQFTIQYLEKTDAGTGNFTGTPLVYLAVGPLPNSDFFPWSRSYPNLDLNYTHTVQIMPALGFVSKDPIVALTGLSANGRNILAFASFQSSGPTTDYSLLNGIQCDVAFTVRTFNITASTNDGLINVTDIGDADESLFDPTSKIYGPGFGTIAQRAIIQLSLLSLINISMYTSVLGNVFISNVQNVYQAAASLSNFPNLPTLNLQGIEEACESMLDDMLAGISSAQLMIGPSNGRTPVPAIATIDSIAIGEARYIYAITVLNFILVALFLAEALRTRGWAQLSKFDYNNLHSVVIASSDGGKGVAKRVATAVINKHHGALWSADPADPAVGRLCVRLVHNDMGIALTAAAPTASRSQWPGKASENQSESVPLVETTFVAKSTGSLDTAPEAIYSESFVYQR